jgi:hypothetical protein
MALIDGGWFAGGFCRPGVSHIVIRRSQLTTRKARIAHLAGPTATIQNTPPLVTSNKARAKHGLPLLTNRDGTPARFDAVRPQRPAAQSMLGRGSLSPSHAHRYPPASGGWPSDGLSGRWSMHKPASRAKAFRKWRRLCEREALATTLLEEERCQRRA